MADRRGSLGKGEVMMFLDMADLNRTKAAELAGISRRHFGRVMRQYRVQAPLPTAKLSANRVRNIRKRFGRESHRRIAASEGVHERTIERLANFETWYWVK